MATKPRAPSGPPRPPGSSRDEDERRLFEDERRLFEDERRLFEDERRLFEAEMKGVRRLPAGRSRVVPDWDSPGPEPPVRPKVGGQELLSLHVEGEAVSGAAFGVANELVRSLARGDIAPEAELDLHHQAAEVAAHGARRFVENAAGRGKRCLLIIHGRGHRSGPAGPVLRDAVVAELRRRPLAAWVLAFTSAPPRHGGAGGLLVLLRRKRG